MLKPILSVFATLSLFIGTDAVRVCGLDGNATYPWHVNDARYDDPDPSNGDGLADIAVSISPGTTVGTLFECNAQWNKTWAGWYEGGSNIIWSDCIWTGNGPQQDITTSFAIDWKNRTLYVSHTFNCSDDTDPESTDNDVLAVGTINLDLNCTTAADNTNHCALKSGQSLTTKIQPPRLSSGSSCAGDFIARKYQSWQLVDWLRSYELTPGSAAPGSTTPPPDDTGPSFTLSNMAVNDVFSCATTVKADSIFKGTCNTTTDEGMFNQTTAEFTFDPGLDFLTVTQRWACMGPSFNATGVGYIQAGCDRHGNLLTCTSKPLWIGTKTWT